MPVVKHPDPHPRVEVPAGRLVHPPGGPPGPTFPGNMRLVDYTLAKRATLTNLPGATLDFRANGRVYNFNGGSVVNQGTLRRSRYPHKTGKSQFT